MYGIFIKEILPFFHTLICKSFVIISTYGYIPPMKSKSPRAIAAALIAVIVWGASFVATKISLRYLLPDTVVWMRFAIGVFILGITVLVQGEFHLPERKDWMYLGLLGFLGITLHQWLQSTALVSARATTTGWIVSTSPIFIALLGWITLKEGLRLLEWSGIFLSAFGVLLVVTRGDFSRLATGVFGNVGDLLILVSAINWAVFSVLSRRGLKKYPATSMMFHVMTIGWILSSILFFIRGGLTQIRAIPWDGWAAIIFLGVFCSGLAYILWYNALKTLPAAQTGAFLYLEPIVTVGVASVILKEDVNLIMLLGGALILAGVWLVNRKKENNLVEDT
jgi:drug/metabolite transporter (DMT)-like permease